MKYEVLSSRELDRLVELVNKALAEGWRPMGGIQVSVDARTNISFYQAVIRDE